jgi:outer membrane protein TolC
VLYPHHDQISRDNFLNLGGGAAYTLTPSVDVFGSVIHTAAGRNGHALQYGATVGVSWSFMKGGRTARAGGLAQAQNRRQARTKALAKCRC